MVTLNDLKRQLEPYKNSLVIGTYEKVVRLVDVIEDEVDYYWVYDSYNGIIYESCCAIKWIPLKGFICNESYNRLLYNWNLNNKEKAI